MDTYFISILSAIIGLFIHYLLLRFAVKHGAMDAFREMGLPNNRSLPSAPSSSVATYPLSAEMSAKPTVESATSSAPSSSVAPYPHSTKGSAEPAVESVTDEQLMEQYGISFDGEHYHFRQYCYNKLSDAVAYAKIQLDK